MTDGAHQTPVAVINVCYQPNHLKPIATKCRLQFRCIKTQTIYTHAMQRVKHTFKMLSTYVSLSISLAA